MIPVLGIPYLNRPDLLAACLESIDHPVERLVIIDNSPEGVAADTPWIVRPGTNLGVAASWNLIIKSTPLAPWWAISNSDLVFGPDDLSHLADALATDKPLICQLEGMAMFGLTAAAVETAGWFDENFVPGYCEDNDFLWRARMTGVKDIQIPHTIRHVGSAVIDSDPALRRENDRTYPANVGYYLAKWGGIMGREVFTTPFDRGGDPRAWQLDLRRLRDLTWRPRKEI